MAEITAKYGDYKGAKVTVKDSLKWFEFSAVSKAIAAANNDAMAANTAMFKIGISSITTPDGKQHTEALDIQKIIDNFEFKDARRVLTELMKLIQEDDSDPKES